MMMESIFSFLPYYFSFIFLAKAKTVNLLVCFSFILGQNSLGQSSCRSFKSNISLELSKEIDCFLYVDTGNFEFIDKYSGGCGLPGHRSFKLAISHKGINGIN